MKDFHISILARAPLGDPQLARDVLRVLVRTHEDLRPARYGSSEPLRGRLDPAADVEEVLQHWTNPMLFNNGRRSAVALWFGNLATHSAVYINCLSSRVPTEVVATLARDLALRLEADLATAYFWRGDQDEWLWRYNAVHPMCLGLTTHEIRRSDQHEMRPIRSRPVGELEPRSFPRGVVELPNSHVASELHRLRDVPVARLTLEDLRFLIAQSVALRFVVPVALEHLERHPLAAGDFYRGDLLNAVATVDETFWTERRDLRQQLVRALQSALARVDKVRTVDKLRDELRAALEHHQSALGEMA